MCLFFNVSSHASTCGGLKDTQLQGPLQGQAQTEKHLRSIKKTEVTLNVFLRSFSHNEHFL